MSNKLSRNQAMKCENCPHGPITWEEFSGFYFNPPDIAAMQLRLKEAADHPNTQAFLREFQRKLVHLRFLEFKRLIVDPKEYEGKTYCDGLKEIEALTQTYIQEEKK